MGPWAFSSGSDRTVLYGVEMDMTYSLHDRDVADRLRADRLCEELIAALPADILTIRELPRDASNVSKLYIERAQESDLYTTVTDALRAKVPWDLWSSVITLDVDPKTAAAVVPAPLFRTASSRS